MSVSLFGITTIFPLCILLCLFVIVNLKTAAKYLVRDTLQCSMKTVIAVVINTDRVA